jgi:transposase-like protein
VAYPLSTRHVEELMEERGVSVDHATINRWVIKYSPQLEEAFHRRKQPVWVSWRLDETYIRVKGEWKYLYRAVDKTGQTIDFLLTAQRAEKAAKRFLTKAIRRHGVPAKITIDGSEANAAAIRSYNKEHGTTIVIRQVKYLNNIIEQDHNLRQDRFGTKQRILRLVVDKILVSDEEITIQHTVPISDVRLWRDHYPEHSPNRSFQVQGLRWWWLRSPCQPLFFLCTSRWPHPNRGESRQSLVWIRLHFRV